MGRAESNGEGKSYKYSLSEYESVRRTCTDEIDINLFMVDHVCMTEGGKDGIMCFCEENKCNGATTTTTRQTGLVSFVVLTNMIFYAF